jgi:predicted PurR-regulated permease PerM
MIDKHRFIKFIVGLLVLVGIIFLLFQMREMLVLLLIASLIAYIFSPFLDFLERRKIPRIVSISLIALIIVGFAVLLIYVVWPTGILENISIFLAKGKMNPERWYKQTIHQTNRFTNTKILSQLIEVINNNTWLKNQVVTVQKSLLEAMSHAGSWVFDYVSSFFSNFFYVVLFPIVTILMMKDGKKLLVYIEHFFDNKKNSTFVRFKETANKIFGNYFRGILILFVSESIVIAIALAIIGIPGAFLIGPMSAFGLFIPYFGLISGLIPSLLLALFLPNPFLSIPLVLLVYILVQVTEVIIQPKIIGDRLGLHPLVILVAIIVGIRTFGVYGVFISVPLAAFIVISLTNNSKRIKKLWS